MQIVWLDQIDDQTRALVGGKAAQLAHSAGSAAIPPGFCLTTVAFEQWRSWQNDPAAATDPLPPALQAALASAYNRFAELAGAKTLAVAVRSSAVDEDSFIASFAGQYQTYLNISGIDAVAAAVAQCWAAATAPRVMAYRSQQGLAEHGEAAVIVQQFIDADVSAVAFSANPVTGVRTEVMINATWGLGESLASGQTTPDIYTVRKRDQSVLAQQIAHKAQMTVRIDQGVALAPVPAAQQARPALTDVQIAAVVRLATELEMLHGWPVDIECAYADDLLYLLQCRPITALPTPDNAAAQPHTEGAQDTADGEVWEVIWDAPEDAGHSWSGGKDLVKPLQQSLSLYYYQGWAKAFHGVAGRGGLRARFVNGYEYRLWQFEPLHSWEEISAAQQAVARDLPVRWQSEWLPAIQQDLARWRAIDLTALRSDELAVHLHDMLNRQLHHWEIHAYMGSVPLDTVQRLVDWHLERFPAAPESEPYRLLQGQTNTSMESNHHLWLLSNKVNYAIEQALRSEAWADLPSPFAGDLNTYLERFSDGTLENRRRTAQLILAYAKNAVPDPYSDAQRLAAERVEFTAHVRARLTPEEQPVFDELLALALAHNPLTEDHNLYLDQQSNGATHLVCQEFGRRLAAEGILDDPAEVEYLALSELIQWGFGLAEPLRPRIGERKKRYAAYARLDPPSYLGKRPEPAAWVDRFSGPAIALAAEPGTIRGVGASPGVVQGPARVVRNIEEALALQPGEVLVCPATDPRWTPLFALAAALVTDHGGSLAHAAVIAREVRLPAVVGTHRATRQIRTGQLLEVDGLSGVVRLR